MTTQIYNNTHLICVSDNGDVFYAQNNELFHIYQSKNKMIKLDLENGETIKSLEIIEANSGIIAIGTSLGNIFIIDKLKVVFMFRIGNSSINNMKLYTEVHDFFVSQSCFLMITTSSGLICRIPIKKLILAINFVDASKLERDEYILNREQVVFSESVTLGINSMVIGRIISSSAIISFEHQSCISTYVLPENPSVSLVGSIKNGIFNIFSRGKNSIQLKEPKLNYYVTYDDSMNLFIKSNSSCRWSAISNSNCRVVIYDCLFGFITAVFKGVRDSQIAWYESERLFLVIYAPHRGTIIFLCAPSFEIICAYRASKIGHLVQYTDKTGKYKALFVDENGQVMLFPKNFYENHKQSCIVEKHVSSNYYFNFQSHIANEGTSILKNINNIMSKNYIEPNEIFDIFSEIKTHSLAHDAIKLVLSCSSINDGTLLTILLKMEIQLSIIFPSYNNVQLKKYFENSFDCCYRECESILKYIYLAKIWKKYSEKREKDHYVPKSQLYQYSLKKYRDLMFYRDRFGTNTPLRYFLRDPLKYHMILFSTIGINKCDNNPLSLYRNLQPIKMTSFLKSLAFWCLQTSLLILVEVESILIELFEIKNTKDFVLQHLMKATDESTFANRDIIMRIMNK